MIPRPTPAAPIVATAVVLVSFFLAGVGPSTAESSTDPVAASVDRTRNPDRDRQAVIAELRRIFDAFVAGDAETLRETHTEDWVGFKAHSGQIVHGLDGYMSTVAFDNPMIEYEFDELEVDLHGDLALVWYVATWKNRLPAYNLTMTMTARSLDIYRFENGRWIQAGSHLAVVPRPGALQHMKSDEIFKVTFE